MQFGLFGSGAAAPNSTGRLDFGIGKGLSI
jgi:hypothetical protein